MGNCLMSTLLCCRVQHHLI